MKFFHCFSFPATKLWIFENSTENGEPSKVYNKRIIEQIGIRTIQGQEMITSLERLDTESLVKKSIHERDDEGHSFPNN